MTLGDRNILDVFLHKKPIKIFLRIKREGYTRQPSLYKGMIVTFSHANILIYKFEEAGLITRIKTGREYEIRLTEVGKKFQDHLFSLKELLELK